MTSDMGLFGLAVMGQNFALNVAEKGFKISVSNRSPGKVDECVKRAKAELGDKADNLTGFPGKTIEEKKAFVESLKKPRRIMFLVKAGAPVDAVIADFEQLLEEGDILIDGGNEWYENSERRGAQLSKKGVHYIAMGVSGGETGARNGPSLMPGTNSKEAYEAMKPILEAASAKTASGNCVTLFLGQGAGNYVKMVHNGIEYADMQLISEVYDLMKHLGLNNDEIAKKFEEWNKTVLDSYLIEITSKIMAKRDVDQIKWSDSAKLEDSQDRFVVDMVLDKTGNKGTGKMTCKEACETGVPAPSIAEALFARFVAADYDARQETAEAFAQAEASLADKEAAGGSAAASLDSDFPRVNREQVLSDLERALYAAKICSYAQGLNIIRTAAQDHGWEVDLGECARIWTGGCIIRAGLLATIKKAYDANPNLVNLMIDEGMKKALISNQKSWRRVVTLCVAAGIPAPAMSTTLAYFDSYKRKRLAANLVQAQRDFFGSHTFERTDKPRGEMYHCKWTSEHA